MKNHRSPGDDGLVIEGIKAGGEIILKSVSELFNKCLHEGTIPKDWNNAVRVLLQKKGDNTKLENYRPISLLTYMYKLFTEILTKRLTPLLDMAQMTGRICIPYGTFASICIP
ncbi:unnamed protein product [Diabrotica balteata]|uniref:Reverse transcriptase domain-containing protein n=1 Tax=Diabrotica balteata TaxID=107213 RepID=A0A9N9SPT1_DIABA|nr:unnamed protein product [Diabrotica balteata]